MVQALLALQATSGSAVTMGNLTIRNIDDRVKTGLRVRAAEHGISMEEEARRILRDAVERERPQNVADLAAEIFGTSGGVELRPHPPVAIRRIRFDPT
jgi:plasmid stability protein